MQTTFTSKLSKTLNGLLYCISTISAILFLILFVGTFIDAHAFDRSVWDWYFFWQPNLENYVLLLLTLILCTKKIRLGLITALYGELRNFWLYFDIFFGNGNTFLSPDILTYTDVLLHYVLLFICIIGLGLWVVEILKKK